MCGIVGLFLKDRSLEPRLGEMLADMLAVMSDRGPDSAGFAVYSDGAPDQVKLTIRGSDLASVAATAGSDAEAVIRDTHLLLKIPTAKEGEIREWIAKDRPDLAIVGCGRRIELYKEVGRPDEVAHRFGLSRMSGTHGIGHTRMATESAVTTRGAHPFSTGADQCLVHNGSLSNHRSLRRTLEHHGVKFATDNDTEVAAGYLSWRLREGASLSEALEGSLTAMDGFYTFVVGTANGFAVLRDPIACKPAVMASTDAYVAFGSEYRALAVLPGIENAEVFEPEPGKVYAWEHS
jgi:methylamine---glutamate N-methyltransferase subunit A